MPAGADECHRRPSRSKSEALETILEASLRVSGEARGATPTTQSSSLSVRPLVASRIPYNSCSSKADSSSQVIAGEWRRAWYLKSKGGSGDAVGLQVNEVSNKSLCGGVFKRLALLEVETGVLVTGWGVWGGEVWLVGEERKHEGVRRVRVSPSWLEAVLFRRLVGLLPCILCGFLGPGLCNTWGHKAGVRGNRGGGKINVCVVRIKGKECMLIIRLKKKDDEF